MDDDQLRLGDEPIDPRNAEQMRGLAEHLNGIINAHGSNRDFGFILMVFEFGGEDARCNYISNACRDDVITLLKDQLERFEAMGQGTKQ